jgi:hypothetical protein
MEFPITGAVGHTADHSEPISPMNENTIPIITYKQTETIAFSFDESIAVPPTISTDQQVHRKEACDYSTVINLPPIKWESLRNEVPITTLQKGFRDLIEQMNQILTEVEQEGGAVEPGQAQPKNDQSRRFLLQEISLEVEVNAEGALSVLGTGAKWGGKGGMQLKFTRSAC